MKEAQDVKEWAPLSLKISYSSIRDKIKL